MKILSFQVSNEKIDVRESEDLMSGEKDFETCLLEKSSILIIQKKLKLKQYDLIGKSVMRLRCNQMIGILHRIEQWIESHQT